MQDFFYEGFYYSVPDATYPVSLRVTQGAPLGLTPDAIGHRVLADYTFDPASPVSVGFRDPYPAPEAQQFMLPAFDVSLLVGENELQEASEASTFILLDGIKYAAPRIRFQRRLGRGAYRVVPASYRGWSRFTPLLPPLPFPAVSADAYDGVLGQTYGSPEALYDALTNVPAGHPIDADFSTPVPGTLLSYTTSEIHEWHWGPAGVDSFNVNSTWFTYPDGDYVTSGGETRYRRFKTLGMTKSVLILGDVVPTRYLPTTGYTFSGGGIFGTEADALREWVSIDWYDPDFDPSIYTSFVGMPTIFVEKLDSPSTHFNDPPGTPGVDDF
ncbi:MAG: hypothetical protein ACT4QA_16465 [Panacagrimonas sp.]